jgi:uncharacterized coiled-coil DUF342 family protein
VISTLILLLVSVLGWIFNSKLNDVKEAFTSFDRRIARFNDDHGNVRIELTKLSGNMNNVRERVERMDQAMSLILSELRERARLEARLEIAVKYAEQIPELKKDLDNLYKRVREVEVGHTV